jgi:hypothetical protein
LIRRWLAVAAVALVLVPFAWASSFSKHGTGPTRALVACGAERWDVKTLTDPGSGAVRLRNARSSTVTKLTRIQPLGPGDARSAQERQVYRVTVFFDSLPGKKLGFKLETVDSDIHLAVRDALGSTMIVEFPDPGCTAGAKYRSRMKSARAALIAACGRPPRSRFRELHGSATITGVLFLDFFHHQRGVARNVAELHPALGFSNATCKLG